MKRFRAIGVALLAVFAMGAIAAAAQAENAPSFSVGGTRLIAGKTHNIQAKVFGAHSFSLNTPALGVKITCTALSIEQGVILGSNPGEPGKASQITSFTNCKLVEGNGAPNCELAVTSHGTATTALKTNLLNVRQVENVEAGGVGKKLLEEFSPAVPSAGFIVLNFTGTGCTTFQTKVSGSTVAEVVLDNASEGNIELGQAPQEITSSLIRFPASTIKEVWLISGGAGKKQTGIEQVAFGFESEQTGTALVTLANGSFVSEPTAKWSALP